MQTIITNLGLSKNTQMTGRQNAWPVSHIRKKQLQYEGTLFLKQWGPKVEKQFEWDRKRDTGKVSFTSYLFWDYFDPLIIYCVRFQNRDNTCRDNTPSDGMRIQIKSIAKSCILFYLGPRLWLQWLKFQLYAEHRRRCVESQQQSF